MISALSTVSEVTAHMAIYKFDYYYHCYYYYCY